MTKPSPIFKPSPTNYADIFTTAIEGGINYWAATDTYDWQFADMYGRDMQNLDPADDFAKAIIVEEETQKRFEIDSRSEIWHNAVSKAARFFDVSLEDFIEDHDASGADVAMQFATLGEIVYG